MHLKPGLRDLAAHGRGEDAPRVRIGGGVHDPAASQDGVFRLGHDVPLRGCLFTVGESGLVEPVPHAHDHRLDADLAGGIVETV
ncbi:hypothetical protein GY12_06940 [Micrococcus luteus]|nr:hypothetical protein GY12_06940 [Micrococcus luteus]